MALIFKPPCDRCGQPYLSGSPSTCINCLRRSQDPDGRRRQERLKCNCGQVAAAVILVRISIGEVISLEPLAVCEDCLAIEAETERDYL
jgi:hypothetical protein